MGNFISYTMTKRQLAHFICITIFFPFIHNIEKCNAQPAADLIISGGEFTVCSGVAAKIPIVISKPLPVFIEFLHKESEVNYTFTSSADTAFNIYLLNVGTYKLERYGTTGDTVDFPYDSIIVSNYPHLSVALNGDGTFCSTSGENILEVDFTGLAPFTLEFYNNGELDTITTYDNSIVFDRDIDRTLKTVRVTDSVCELDTIASIDHKVIAVPKPEISGKDVICLGDEGTYSTDVALFSYNWSIPDDAAITGAGNIHSRAINVQWTGSGNKLVRLQLVDKDSKCESEWDNFYVTVSDYPVAEVNIDTAICFELNGSIIIDIPIANNEHIFWPGLNSGNTSVTFTEGGNYTYHLINESECADTGLVTILDSCTTTLFVPEAFTPNGDGINELLEIFGLYRDLEFRIYSESGILLFTMFQGEDFWDGKMDDKEAPTGTYYWTAKYSAQRGIQLTQNGHVVLLR